MAINLSNKYIQVVLKRFDTCIFAGGNGKMQEVIGGVFVRKKALLFSVGNYWASSTLKINNLFVHARYSDE